MTERQQRFCEFYAQNPNATQAAISAGFSEKTAYSQGQRMLRNVEIQKHIAEITAPEQGQRIADALEVQQLWTSVLRDSEAKTRDRLEAGKLLFAAQAGAAQTVGNDDSIVDADSEAEEKTGRTFLLPFNGSGDISAVILPDGSWFPLPGHENDDVLVYLSDEPTEKTRYRIWKKTQGEVDICGMQEPYLSQVIAQYLEE